MRRVWTLTILTLAAALLADAAIACPSCGNAVGKGDSGHMPHLQAGVYYSILFMLAVPASLLSGFSFAFYRLHKRAVADRSSPVLGRTPDAPFASPSP